MEKEQKQELGWRVSVLPIPAFHCTSLHDSVVIHSTSGSDIHDGRAEVVFSTAYTASSADTGDTILQNTAKEVLD